MGMLIFAQIKADPEHAVLAHIRLAIKAVNDESSLPTDEQRKRALRICESAASYLDVRTFLVRWFLLVLSGILACANTCMKSR